MTNEIRIMHRVLNFVQADGIGTVSRIYENEVDENMLSWLIRKSESIMEQEQNNTTAWMRFISQLDNNNSEILMNHILNPKF